MPKYDHYLESIENIDVLLEQMNANNEKIVSIIPIVSTEQIVVVFEAPEVKDSVLSLFKKEE